MQPVVWLFDVDGVLVQPGGYRAAVSATINHFTRQMGLGELAPSDETMAVFEAQGITCEWDMISLSLAIILEAACQQVGPGLRLDSLAEAGAALAGRTDGLQVAFDDAVRKLGRFVNPGQTPSEAMFAACAGDLAEQPFPGLSGQGILRQLLLNTRRPALSPTTHVFETYVLGDTVFSAALGLRAEVRSESLLSRYDRPLLDPATRERLVGWIETGRLQLAAYTARPSAPLHDPTERLAVYMPEAELALALVGLVGIPLVGAGQVGEAARLLDEDEDRLAKPAPYHALMATAAAITGNRPAAMQWASKVFRHIERGEPSPGLYTPVGRLPERMELHVFEDSPSGMAGGRAAAQILTGLGGQVDLHLWGISSHPEKAAALVGQGARIFADINQAVAAAAAAA